MDSKTVKQFKALFPTSATSLKLFAVTFTVQLVILKLWSARTLDDLKRLVRLFGVVGKLKLSKHDQLGI